MRPQVSKSLAGGEEEGGDGGWVGQVMPLVLTAVVTFKVVQVAQRVLDRALAEEDEGGGGGGGGKKSKAG